MVARTLLLKGAGYVVNEAYERTAALSRAQCDSIDVLLICHTVPKAEKRWLIINVREKRRLLPILCLTFGIHELPSDYCIRVRNDPEELLNALKLAVKFPGPSEPAP
jgi:hypothetical protein